MTRRRTSFLALLAATALTLTGSFAPAMAKPKDKPAKAKSSYVYDALGDSYASGAGVGPYRPCGQSDAAYALQIDGRMKLALDDFVACGGATVATLISGGQLNALDADTDVVTLTIGGNDTGWGTVVGACLVGSDAQCAGALASAKTFVNAVMPSRLGALYAQVAAKAPNAAVYVTGYPRLFTPEAGAYFNGSPTELQALNDAADVLNGVIKKAATDKGFHFVDVTKRFDGHGANSADPYLTGLTAPVGLHPNAAGWAAYSDAVTAAIKPGRHLK